MDILTIIYSISVSLFLLLIYWFLCTKKGKGFGGERIVKEKLNKLNPKEYLVINNLRINKYQIDHIVVSRYGIFVIETKNWSGRIYGRGWDSKWKQYFRGIKEPVSFPKNPIYQNKSHLYILKKSIPELNDIPLFPIIVVSGLLERKIYKDPCIKVSELLKTIYSYKDPLISEEVKNDIFEKISKL